MFKSYWPVYGGRNANKPFRNYTKPCNKMTVLSNINQVVYRKNKDILKIKFRIGDVVYQEVLNNRGFGMDNLWASIGGYVGIFCGYSLLQASLNITQFIKSGVKFFKGIVRNLKKG